MNERRYDIHGLVEVLITPDVRPELIREIEFQIGSFRGDGPARQGPGVRILIQPYAQFRNLDVGGEPAAVFYNTHGVVDSFIEDESNRLVVCRDEEGFRIYADYANVLINLYIQFLISRQGFGLVHAAAYKHAGGGVTVLAGAGGIGKTAVLGYAVRERGLQQLGDDLVIASADGRCLSFPRAFVLKSYHREGYADTFRQLKLPKWNLYALKRFLIDNAPFVGVSKSFLRRTGLYYKVADLLRPQPFLATVSPEQLFGEGSTAASGDIARIAYLDRVKSPRFSIRTLEPGTLVNRLFSVIHYEWKDFLTHVISLGSLAVIDLPTYFGHVRQNLSAAVEGKELLQIDIPEGATPEELVSFLDAHGFFSESS